MFVKTQLTRYEKKISAINAIKILIALRLYRKQNVLIARAQMIYEAKPKHVF